MVNLKRELKFALKDKVVSVAILVSALLSIYTLLVGLHETRSENALIERVEQLVDDDREYALAKQDDPGDAAYYAFHFTFDPPSELAFVARGVRDELPWKHRIRMLALEGQIYEADSGNPELSRIGKLDFAFLIAFLLPLMSILLLYDLRAVEVRNNRWAFLCATSGDGTKLLRLRSMLRTGLLFCAVGTPLFIIALLNGAEFGSVLLVLFAILASLVLWNVISLLVVSRVESGPTVAAILVGCWFALAVVIPVGGKLIVEQSIEVPRGGELLLAQREKVNTAWDLPKQATMTPFFERHPQWRNSPAIARPFEWKWYFAFQQVGDQTVEPVSKELRNNVAKRDRAMNAVAFISPPLLAQRLITKAAQTDISAFQRYDQCVREFHADLREFYYPMLFGDQAYSAQHIKNLPEYAPCSS